MFPDMKDALSGFSKSSQFSVISKTVVDYEVAETNATIGTFTGVLQPISAQKLSIKPEGQRAWKWWTLWTAKRLKVDDEIKDLCNRQFRVMEVSDWGDAGHYKYELMEQPV